MKTKIVMTCLVTGALLLPIAGYTADGDSDRSSPTAFVKDSVITVKIKAEVAAKMSYKDHVKVDTDAKGVVHLGGNVRSQAEADQVVAIANSVKGVTSVRNNIAIKTDL
jgi:hyperosmotically inducible protein